MDLLFRHRNVLILVTGLLVSLYLIMHTSNKLYDQLFQKYQKQQQAITALTEWNKVYASLKDVPPRFQYLYPVSIADIDGVLDVYRAIKLPASVFVDIDQLRVSKIDTNPDLSKVALFSLCLTTNNATFDLVADDDKIDTLLDAMIKIEKKPYLSFTGIDVSVKGGKPIASLSDFCITIRGADS